MSRTFKLTIAYDGTDFAGWQVQPGQQTIQGNLHRALRRVTGQQIHVVGSGRTDAGVHAIAQVASLTVPSWRHDAASLARAINAQLPPTIVVTNSVDAPPRFHAIRDAVSKRYRYQLQIGGLRDVFDHRYRWHFKTPLDTERMRQAAQQFVGTHDFASFQATGAERKTTVRTVTECQVIEQSTSVAEVATTCDPPRNHNRNHVHPRSNIAIEIEADGFLYNMVRNIVGTIVEIGWGKRTPESIKHILEASDRDAAGQTAPAYPLFLLRVDYQPFPIEAAATSNGQALADSD